MPNGSVVGRLWGCVTFAADDSPVNDFEYYRYSKSDRGDCETIDFDTFRECVKCGIQFIF